MNNTSEEFKKITLFIEDNNAELAEGSNDALKMLEQLIAEFSVFMQNQPVSEASGLKDDIENLAEYLKKLSDRLNLKHSDVVMRIEQLKLGQRATVAYHNRLKEW